jgi:hypothetical protein
LLQELLRPALPALAGAVSPALTRFRRLTMHCKALAFVTMVSGAFVAGLDAGGTLAPLSYLSIFFSRYRHAVLRIKEFKYLNPKNGF